MTFLVGIGAAVSGDRSCDTDRRIPFKGSSLICSWGAGSVLPVGRDWR